MHFFFLFNVILCFLIRYKGIGFLLRDGDKENSCPNHLGEIS
nr:MAG TPA: hypothetical protein [Caudoviricetes sp.]